MKDKMVRLISNFVEDYVEVWLLGLAALIIIGMALALMAFIIDLIKNYFFWGIVAIVAMYAIYKVGEFIRGEFGL